MKKNVTRRDFLKGAAVGAAGVATLGVLGACGTQQTAPKTSGDIAWDAEYDVVVLGYGAAGANAAVAAVEKGAKVLLTEKAPMGSEGGNSQASGQFVMCTDDANQLYTYLSTLMGKFKNWDNEALKAYCEGCTENFSWMTGAMGGDPNIICPVDVPASEARMAANWS